jgi:hypothetical protein
MGWGSTAQGADRHHGNWNAQSREMWVKRSHRLRPLDPLDVDAIPMDAIPPALVVIPTNSAQNHSKSNSALIGK